MEKKGIIKLLKKGKLHILTQRWKKAEGKSNVWRKRKGGETRSQLEEFLLPKKEETF